MSWPTWHGIQIKKSPTDLWMMGEILWRTLPTLLIECGTGYGGSALYVAHLMDLTDYGRIITIDHRAMERPEHPRIHHILADTRRVSLSIDPRHERIMVLLDSEHTVEHVTEELTIYAPLVSPDCYLIVEYTDHDGPRQAVEKFLPDHSEFEVDQTCEPELTHNPGGYLRRRHE